MSQWKGTETACQRSLLEIVGVTNGLLVMAGQKVFRGRFFFVCVTSPFASSDSR